MQLPENLTKKINGKTPEFQFTDQHSHWKLEDVIKTIAAKFYCSYTIADNYWIQIRHKMTEFSTVHHHTPYHKIILPVSSNLHLHLAQYNGQWNTTFELHFSEWRQLLNNGCNHWVVLSHDRHVRPRNLSYKRVKTCIQPSTNNNQQDSQYWCPHWHFALGAYAFLNFHRLFCHLFCQKRGVPGCCALMLCARVHCTGRESCH